MIRRFLLSSLAAAFWVSPVSGQELTEQEAFVESNILAIFYHELGHAVIDLMEVPIFGQEEDAADVIAVLLVDWLYDEEVAQAIAFDSAFGFLNDPTGEEEIPFWDVHGPDEQRFYNHVCLFYGANPDARADWAEDLGLPEDRAAWCPEEYDQAAASWGAVFDDMDAQVTRVPMVFIEGRGPDADVPNRLLMEEVRAMNEELRLPWEISVEVASCDEANAFYDPSAVSITFCTEFVPHLEDLFEQSLN